MKWDELLQIVADEPVFTPGFLLAGDVGRAGLRGQISRWARAGRLLQIRRGLYALAEPFRKVSPHPFLAANRMKRASYVSLQSALRYYDMIPENVPVVTSVTTGRPERVETPLGRFVFRHVRRDWFTSFRSIDLGDGQSAMIASPEKALLDLVYLVPRADDWSYLRQLRLANLAHLDAGVLMRLAEAGGGKLLRAAGRVLELRGGGVAYRTP